MAKTEKELKELKEEFIEFTNQIKELSDEELEQVTGGVSFYDLTFYDTPEQVQFLYKAGEEAEVSNIFGLGTVRCRIIETGVELREVSSSGVPGMPGTAYYRKGYVDKYNVEEIESHWYFVNGWKYRSSLEK